MDKNKAAGDREQEWRRLLYRRSTLIVLMLVAAAVGYLLYRWVSHAIVKGPVGEFYQKTVDTDATGR
jgi:hypothetical protein